MNIIFGAILLISTVIITIKSPNELLSTYISGGQKALELTGKLLVVYAIWLGVFSILENCNVLEKLSKFSKPFNRKLFGKLDDKSEQYISVNITANLLGFSGATTPFGIKSVNELSKYKNTYYATCMFFVINATSIQIIPSSVLALRSSMNSLNPSSIIIPTILATLVSTIVGVLLVKIFIKKDNE